MKDYIFDKWNIRDIESVTEEWCKDIGFDVREIKGHNVYLVDFGGYFKRSLLVFRNGKHIYYANDYELHHPTMAECTDEEIYDYMLKNMEWKLFADDEYGEITDYDDYDRKAYYLHNYYVMQTERESIFAINPTDEEKRAFKEKTKGWTYDPAGFCYIPDAEFVARHIKLMNQLNKAKERKADDFEYYKDAFKSEMYNHEYSINWEADYDTLSAFGNIEWHEDDLNAYFKELGFTETQKKAYMAARAEYYKEINYDYELDCVV